jgi:Tol biopolymer transport system component
VLALLVLAFGAGLVLNLLPDELIGRSPTPVSSGTPVAEASTPVVTAIDTTPGVIVTLLPSPAVTEVSSPVPVDTDPATLPPTVRPTASLPVPTPSGPIAGYWDDAKGAYDNHEWQTSLDYLTLVRRIDADYRREEIDTMLFDIQMGLAATAAASGNLDKAGEYLDAAVALRPDVAQVEAIQRALQALVAPNTLNKSMARWTLATELLKYGQTLLAVDNPCAAAEQFQAAGSVLPNADVTKLLTESEAACAEVKQAAAVREQLALLSGRLLYSTQEDNVYRIYRANAAAEAPSTLVMEDGAQPARQRRGNVVAFHSTSETAPGIATFDLSSGSSPSVRTGRITTAPEDAHDAPPSWGPADRQLAFGTTATGDRRSRVNLIDAQAPETQTPLGLGRDPAWHPTEDRIIYNGLNDVGAEPGLWTMKSDGSARDRVTDNGNDIRPVWTPDGNDVVFMSSRDGNWEVYRVTVESGVMLRLTNDPAQDGLPSVSPDGKWVAFASDRGKFWRVWVVSIDGGEAMPVLTMNGVLTNWLEHAIQWIP